MADTTKDIATSVVEEIQLEEDDLFHCKLLSIKVENRIFRVPRELLETYSDVYKDMFKFPVANDEPADGERDSAPLVLDGIKKEAFRAFLSVLSSLHYESMTKPEETEKNVFIIARLPLYKGLRKEDWIAALRLSHMWNLENVRKKAIEALESDATLGMIQRLKLANEFQITNWIRPAHRYLLMRTEDLKSTEVPWLGPDFVRNVSKAREERTKLFLLRILSRDIPLPSCPTCGEATLKIDTFLFYPPFITQPRQVDSIKWSFRCCSLSAHHKRTSLFAPQPNAPPSSWTLEQLVESLYKTAGEPVKSLMEKDVDMLIHRFLPSA